MDTPATPLPFRITTDGMRGTVEVDGCDVSERVEGVEFLAGFGDLPKVMLHFAPGAAVLEGEAIVHVVDPEASPAAAVRSIDPAVVAARMDQRNLSMADDPHAVLLEIVAEILEGA